MAVINDNGPEESWDTGATYIIPSHQSMHLCGLFSANQHTTVKKKEKTPYLLSYHHEASDSLWTSWMIAEQGSDM